MTRARTSRKKGVMGRMYGRPSRANPADAVERYKIFHKKDPRGVVTLRGLPREFVEIGRGEAVMYETDKWEDDGNDTRYKHLHNPGVRVFEAASAGAGDTTRLPVTPPAPDEGFARLGKCLGYFVRVGNAVREYNPPNTDLFASPSGDLLAVYCRSRGWIAFMAGGALRVEAEGIDG